MYNWQTLQVMFESISGALFQLNSKELLLLTTTTLYQIDMFKVDGITEIKHFDFGVQDSLSHEPQSESDERILVVSSSITYIYSTLTHRLTELNFAFSKLLFCNTEYLGGLSATGG